MKACFICKKGSVKAGQRSFLRSHYNPTATLRKRPNLQWAKLPTGKRAKVCADCLKSLHK